MGLLTVFGNILRDANQGRKDIAHIYKNTTQKAKKSKLWETYQKGLVELELKKDITFLDTPIQPASKSDNSGGFNLSFNIDDIPQGDGQSSIKSGNYSGNYTKPSKERTPKIGSKREPETDPQKIVRILDSLKISATFNSVKMGSNSDIFNFSIKSIMKKALKETQELELQLGVEGINIYGGEVGGTIDIVIPRKETKTLWLEDYIHKTTPSTLEFIAGESVNKIITQNLSKLPHIIISGGTGSGKTASIDNLLYTFIMNNTPDELELVIIDPKVVGLSKYSGIPHLVYEPILNNPQDSYGVLQEMVNEMDIRYRTMAQNAGKRPEELFSRLVIVIDELADLFDSDYFKENDIDILAPINKIARKGRQCNMHLLLATQTARADIMKGQLKANIEQWVLRATNKNEVRVTGAIGSDKLRGDGDGYLKLHGQSEFQRIQAPWIEESEVIRLIEEIKSSNQE